MNSLLKWGTGLLIYICAMPLFTSCQEDDANFKVYQYPVPQVASISPGSGYVGTKLYLKGKNFGAWKQAVTVLFKGDTATVDSCADSLIVVTVPKTAVSGKVSLKVWTHSVDSVGTYNVMPLPTIVSVTSNNSIGANIAAPGDEVTIIGTSFGTDFSKVSVSFNGTPAVISSLADNKIVVTTPDAYASGSVIVTVNGVSLTGTALLNPNVKGDITIFYLKNYQQPFTHADWLDGEKGSSGGWCRPSSWTINSAMKNQINPGGTLHTGGMDFNKDKVNGNLCMQAGWGNDSQGNVLTNGKMYQTTTLPAGDYKLEFTVPEGGYAGGSNVYFAIAKGDSLPDVGNVPVQSMKYIKNFLPSTTNRFEFTLSEKTQVSIGFVATMLANSWVRISSIKLTLE